MNIVDLVKYGELREKVLEYVGLSGDGVATLRVCPESVIVHSGKCAEITVPIYELVEVLGIDTARLNPFHISTAYVGVEGEITACGFSQCGEYRVVPWLGVSTISVYYHEKARVYAFIARDSRGGFMDGGVFLADRCIKFRLTGFMDLVDGEHYIRQDIACIKIFSGFSRVLYGLYLADIVDWSKPGLKVMGDYFIFQVGSIEAFVGYRDILSLNGGCSGIRCYG